MILNTNSGMVCFLSFDRVTTEEALAALQREAARNQEDLKQEELEDLAEFYRLKKQRVEGEAGAYAEGSGRAAGGKSAVGGSALSVANGGSSSDEEGLPAANKAAAKRTMELSSMPPPPARAPQAQATASKPIFKVIAKPKASKPTPVSAEPKQAEVGLSGLLGGYGSSDSESQ